MAAGPVLLDVNTGQPAATSYNQQPRSETVTTQSGGRTDTTQTSGTTETSQRQSSRTASLNTTPIALEALNSLISSLTERPAISEEELNAKAPMVTPQYSPSGWLWHDPLTGRYVRPAEATALNAQRKAQQATMKQQAGTLPAGTAEQQRQQGERTTEIGRSRAQQGQYSKDAALADSQALVNKAIADALRAAEPGITLASEGAGTSKSTYRAGALQEAAVRGGIEGAALGANLSVAYGQIYNQLEGILEQLTKIDPNGPTAMLLNALQASKGMVQDSTTEGETSGTQQSTGQQTTNVGPESKTAVSNRDYSQPSNAMPALMPNQPAAASQPTNPYYAFSNGPGSSNIVVSNTTPATSDAGAFDANQAYQEVAMSDDEY